MKIKMASDGIWQILFLSLMGSCIVFGGPNLSRLSKSAQVSFTDTSYKLPQYTKPTEYWLEINPNISAGAFKGEVTIRIVADPDSRDIILHSEDLVIKNVVVYSIVEEDKRKIESSFSTYTSRSTLEIHFTETIEGPYYVIITFEGVLEKHHPFGFALHNEVDKEYIAGTFFEPIFARKVFPCYDEPHFRTPFTLTVLKRTNENVRSIMHYDPNEGSGQNSEKKITFAKTDPIPTHMLAYAIFNSQGYSGNTYGGAYTVWSRKTVQNQVSYALETISAIVEEMIDFTDTRLPSPIKDFIVLPSELGRNTEGTRWESLFHVEKNILCDANECSQAYQHRITTNLARQVSYEWFGKYVSIESWRYLWLKQGFAKYFSYELFEEINPSWELSDFHGSIQMQTTLFEDVRYFKQPLTKTNDLSTRHIVEMYKYSSLKCLSDKAALILRMLEHIVGKHTFKRAIRRFLRVSRKGQGGLITPALLWLTFDAQLKDDERVLPAWPGSSSRQMESISSIMEPYTTLPGYPIIKAKKESGNRINFDLDYYIDSEENKNSVWYVPITITTRSELNFRTTAPLAWSSTNTSTHLGISIKADEWYIVNVKNTAYCRVHYTDNNWKLLIKQLHDDPTKIHRLNRAQLISDSHQLAFDGQIPYYVPIILSSYLYKENDPMVWMTAFRAFKRFYTTISERLRPLYQEYFVKCLKHEYKRTGFETKAGDTRATKIWRSEMLAFLCWIGHKGCIESAKNEYQKHKSDLTGINADLQFVVWCTMLRVNSKALNNAAFTRSLKNMRCRKEVFDAASTCSLSPMENKDGLVYTYKNLASDLLTMKDDDACAYITEMTTYQWDSVAGILKMVEKEIMKMRDMDPTFYSDSKIKKLAKLIRCLDGLISGRAEYDAINRINRMVGFLNGYTYFDLVDAIRQTHLSADSGGIKIEEDLLETILSIHGCPEVEGDKDEESVKARSSLKIALKFFDENMSVEPVDIVEEK